MIGYLTVNTFAAFEALPIAGARVIIEKVSGEKLFDTLSDQNGNTPLFELEAPDVALTLDQRYRGAAYAVYNVKVSARGFADVVIKNCQIVATATAVLNVEMHPLPVGAEDYFLRNGAENDNSVNYDTDYNTIDRSRAGDAIERSNIANRNAREYNYTTESNAENYITKNIVDAKNYEAESGVQRAMSSNEKSYVDTDAENTSNTNINARGTNYENANENTEINYANITASAQKTTEEIDITPLGLLLPVQQRQYTGTVSWLRPVFIPDYITVHLGSPNSSAENVRVPFAEYVANCASSEIYPTWPHNALVANIHCITTFAINRIYTEWYRSRGYNFDITNSTAYDQYFVKGRNIYANILEIAQNVFNVYARRVGYHNPFFTQFCNGTTTTCQGLSQWGTVNLAKAGRTPLEILHAYFPDDLELVSTNNIRGIEETFPGTALRIGSSGEAVRKMQNYLNRIRANFPLIPQISSPNGTFDRQTEQAVRTFQRTFVLSDDGVIGRATWNKISFIYFGVIRLAELNSEGERIGIGANPPTSVLKNGSSGEDVLQLQFLINYIADFYSTLPTVIMDGRFGAQSQNAVMEFQRAFGLRVDGVVGPTTWNALYDIYRGIRENAPVPEETIPPAEEGLPYPGTLLKIGSTGENVRIMQAYLNTIRTIYPTIPQLLVDGVYGANTKSAVVAFQQEFLLPPDGIIGPVTWDKIVEMYLTITGRA